MARSEFGGTIADFVTKFYEAGRRQLLQVTSATVTLWDAETAGTQVTDLLVDGVAATQLTIGDDGQIPLFQGPDGVTELWASADGGTRVRMTAGESARVSALEASVATKVDDAEVGAASGVAPLGADARVPEANLPAHVAEAALSATYGRVGANVARFVQRARSGETLTITCLGDSILEGTTVTNPATDGAMILLAADLSTRFGNTVTQTNHASSGYTAARAHINGNVTAAVAENADLYIISAFDKNDLGPDIYGEYAPGYPLNLSLASIERMVRAIRTEVPKADIILMSTNPYESGTAANTQQQEKDTAVRRIAAAYGCEWVDCYQAFIDEGDYSSLLADSTHPNTAGHRLIADTLLEHLLDLDRTPIQPGAVATYGLHSPELVDTTAGDYGYVSKASPGTGSGVTYTTGGTGWLDEATSTVGDYVEVTAQATELLIQLSTAVVDATVVDVAVDGVTVDAGVNLSTLGKNGNYWIVAASGLDGTASHTVRLTLVSGTLRTFSVAALLGGDEFTPAVTTQAVASTVATTTLTTSYQDLVNNVTVALPAGWTSMDVQLTGWVSYRCSGATTAVRRIDTRLTNLGSVIHGILGMEVPVKSATTTFTALTVNGLVRGLTADASISLQAKVDDATDTLQALQWHLNALLIRTA